MSSFMWVDLSHVYREHNRRADILSKEGLHMAPGHLILTEFYGNEIIGESSVQLFQNMHFFTSKYLSSFVRHLQVFVEHHFTDYLSITPSLDQIFGFLLCSLGTQMTVLDCLLMRGFSQVVNPKCFEYKFLWKIYCAFMYSLVIFGLIGLYIC